MNNTFSDKYQIMRLCTGPNWQRQARDAYSYAQQVAQNSDKTRLLVRPIPTITHQRNPECDNIHAEGIKRRTNPLRNSRRSQEGYYAMLLEIGEYL